MFKEIKREYEEALNKKEHKIRLDFRNVESHKEAAEAKQIYFASVNFSEV